MNCAQKMIKLYIYILMNKNQFSPQNSYKNLDIYKTNSVILGQPTKLSSNAHIHPQKNGREAGQNKIQTIQRHSSEDDLKQLKKKQHFQKYQPYNDDLYRPENQYFMKGSMNQQSFQPKKISKNINYDLKYRNSKESNDSSEGSHKNFLKETSSTQSAENLRINQRFLPSFMKSKLSKKLGSICMEYNGLKIQTSRNKLRRENFKIITKLGEGKFGKVFMVKQMNTGFILAMKLVEKKKIIKEKLLEQFIRQLRIQSFLNHANIISLYGFFHDQTHFYTLMELGCDGQLYSLMCNSKKKVLNEQTTSFIIKNLLQAIDYMHVNKVLHRDVKPQNIVLIMGNVKICDFGWAVNKHHSAELRGTICGTPLYLSPELLNGSKYDEKVDIWATGILAYELMVGCSPFQIIEEEDLHKIINEEILFPEEKELSVEFKQFILSMLEKNPKERMTSKKLLREDFIRKYEEFETCEQLCK